MNHCLEVLHPGLPPATLSSQTFPKKVATIHTRGSSSDSAFPDLDLFCCWGAVVHIGSHAVEEGGGDLATDGAEEDVVDAVHLVNGLQHQIIKSGISQHPQIKSFSIFETGA